MITMISIVLYAVSILFAAALGTQVAEWSHLGKTEERREIGLMALFLSAFLFVSAASLQIFA